MTLTPPTVTEAPRGATRVPPRGRRSVPSIAALVAAIGLGASVALPFRRESWAAFTAPGGAATFFGDITALAGTYLLLVMVLLAARIPAIERVAGQDGLIRWHRRLSSAPLLLLGAHGVLTILGYAESARVGFFSEAGTLITTVGWIFASVVSYVMLVAIAGASIRAARRRLNYDTWWVIHLYTYLALAFSVPHQIFDGTDFVGHPLVQDAWLALWFATAGTVLAFRVGLPIVRSMRHGLRVVSVQSEGPGVYSMVVRGRSLNRLAIRGGQYLGWRFLAKGLWWHAHPFSISAMPQPPFLRVTIKAAGDTSSTIASLRPGTPVAIEGPYGTFTAAAMTRQRVALIGAGVGITPLRALLEDLPPHVDLVVVQRASTDNDLIHHHEIAQLVSARRGRLVELVGSRSRYRLDHPSALRQLVPDIADRDVYVCGPEDFAAGVERAAQCLGVVRTAIHRESFQF